MTCFTNSLHNDMDHQQQQQQSHASFSRAQSSSRRRPQPSASHHAPLTLASSSSMTETALASSSVITRRSRSMRSPLLGGLALVISMATITHAEVASGGVQAAFSEGLPLTKASGIQRSTNLKSAMQPSTPTFPPGKKEGGGVGNLLQRMQQLSPLLRNKNHQRSSPPAAGVDVDVLTERAAAKQPQAVANHGDGEVMPWKDFLELKKNPAATAAPPLASSSSASPKIGLDCGWSCIPHPSKVHRGGEDVHIVSRAGGCTLTGVL
eukprot:CAMPEP_0177705658 /NCGR_PEP_ID=MMETSP0484_2-20121128/8823_1 /TAXON_ID=354590 /ORGANISM="Rhodomonas lens, Strain RHODO" /LENGTH=264 /DNA_ID=CAMNT_0019217095 /DNA_START=167 /DNA_END=958 /DNA_ORIENTATION=+